MGRKDSYRLSFGRFWPHSGPRNGPGRPLKGTLAAFSPPRPGLAPSSARPASRSDHPGSEADLSKTM